MADGVAQHVVFRMVDIAGKTGTVGVYVVAGSGDPITTAAGLEALINACSNAEVIGAVGQTANNTIVGTSATNAYDIRDKLAVEFIGSQNDHHVIHVGDPATDIWLANNEQVDITNSKWTALVSAIQSNIIDKSGGAVTVLRGYRTRSRKLKSSLRFV